MEPNENQQRLLEKVAARENATGIGVPGCGKTQTASFITEQAKSGIALCYMKNAKEELAKRITNPRFQVNNFHSLGRGMLGTVQLKKFKVYDMMNDMVKLDGMALSWDTVRFISENDNELATFYREQMQAFAKCIAAIKHNLLDYDDEAVRDRLAADYILDAELVAQLQPVMKANNANAGEVDFDDMLYLPNFLGKIQVCQDLAMLDEAQDLNVACQQLGSKIAENLVVLGQREQAIMGFAGADIHSMDYFRDHQDCEEIHLDTCYRCDTAIIEDFNRLAEVQAVPREGAEEGLVTDAYEIEEVPINGSFMLLCRTKAPCFAAGYKLLKEGKRVCFKGSDIMDGIVKNVKSFKENRLRTALGLMRKLTDKKIEILKKGKYPPEARIEMLEDEFTATKKLIEISEAGGKDDIKGLAATVKKLKESQPDSIDIMTGHTSKGLEKDNVVILNADKCRIIKPDSSEDDIQQEINLEYVMRSRAKHATYSMREGEEGIARKAQSLRVVDRYKDK